jgi:hypothetical protein
MRKILVIILALFFGCSDSEQSFEYPVVTTDGVGKMSADGIEVYGTVVSSGKSSGEFTHGFVFGGQAKPTLEASSVLKADQGQEGRFSKIISGNFPQGDCHVRAFVQSGKWTVYGEDISFSTSDAPGPVITSFSPAEGFGRETMTIRGKHFTRGTNTVDVDLGDGYCWVQSVSDTLITIQVPEYRPYGQYPISVKVAGKIGVSSSNFTFRTPRILSVSKTSGRTGDEITITGEHFRKFPVYVSFSSGPSQVPFEIQSDNTILARLPDRPGVGALVLSWGNSYRAEFQEYISVIDSWSNTFSTCPVRPELDYSTSVNGNSIYLIGGKSLYEYNTVSKIWLQRKAFPGAFRFGGVSFVANGKLYYGFGAGYHDVSAPYLNGQYYNDLWMYDPATDDWTSISASTPVSKRTRQIAMTINNKIYLALGSINNSNGFATFYTDFWEYNVGANSWTRIASPLSINFGWSRGAFVMGSKGYLVGIGEESDLWEFDPSIPSWTKKKNLPASVDYISGGTYGDRGLVLVSDNYGASSVYEYIPASDRWIQRQSLRHVGEYRFAEVANSKFYFGGDHTWEMSLD